MNRKTCVVLVAMLSLTLFAASTFAEELYVYPAKGQSASKMEKDKSDCRTWAMNQGGTTASSQPQAQPESSGPKGQRIKGGARGAAGGAAVGAIAGDAGKGAAIGAVAGEMRGGREARQERREEKSEAQQKAQAQQQQTSANFNKAYGACLEGRGYSVK